MAETPVDFCKSVHLPPAALAALVLKKMYKIIEERIMNEPECEGEVAIGVYRDKICSCSNVVCRCYGM